MNFDFIKHREQENIVPVNLEGKEQYHLDLINIHQSWTGRVDAMFSNDFFREAIQLIINAISLFENGYFDCAFYSLRQSLEIATTIVYFVDDNEENRSKQILKWKKEERFPMHTQMINELKNRKKEFADIRDKMSSYFEEIEITKQRLNKYVHKQGHDKFYIFSNHPLNQNKDKWREKLMSDFETFLKQSIGVVAVFRLVIDPFPLLLADEEIYKRTGQLMTEGYSNDFIEKYIGTENIESYKKTELYKGHYNLIIDEEEMLPSVLDVVKHDFIDRTKISEILSQKHLLSNHQLVAVALIIFSEKIVKVYCIGGFHWYFTNIQTKRTKMSWGSYYFKIFKEGNIKYNVNYDEVFLSYVKIKDEDYYIEHNDTFTDKEIIELEEICTTHNKES